MSTTAEGGTDPRDRRFSRIELAGPVKEWVKRDLPATRLGPFTEAMSRATPKERAVILEGLGTLERLVVSGGGNTS